MMQFIQISSRVKWADALWVRASRDSRFLKAAKSLQANRNYIEIEQFKIMLNNTLQQPAKQAI